MYYHNKYIPQCCDFAHSAIIMWIDGSQTAVRSVGLRVLFLEQNQIICCGGCGLPHPNNNRSTQCVCKECVAPWHIERQIRQKSSSSLLNVVAIAGRLSGSPIAGLGLGLGGSYGVLGYTVKSRTCCSTSFWRYRPIVNTHAWTRLHGQCIDFLPDQ